MSDSLYAHYGSPVDAEYKASFHAVPPPGSVEEVRQLFANILIPEYRAQFESRLPEGEFIIFVVPQRMFLTFIHFQFRSIKWQIMLCPLPMVPPTLIFALLCLSRLRALRSPRSSGCMVVVSDIDMT